jgi:uncharacterized protein (DUF305 family)
MRPSQTRPITAALAAAGVAWTCLHASLGAAQAPPVPPSRPADAAQSESAYVARARADSALHPYTESDVFFMSGMIGHHAQAIVMAKWAPTHGASPSVRTLCERIINAQQDEIAAMQTWLRDRRQTVPDAQPGPMKMMMNGMEHEMMMPGMLSDAQMKELDAARGPDFDRLFLTFMIQHHRGALTMVKELFGTQGAAQDATVFKFASDVSVDQTTEINRMVQMLTALPAASSVR